MDLTIDQRVRAVISQELGLAEVLLASDATLATDLGADSSDQLSLTLALEDEFGIEIPDHDAQILRTVRQVVIYVQEKVGSVGV